MTKTPPAPSRAFLFSLDALLLVLGLLLMSPRLTGLASHEWIGIAFLLPLLVHLLVSWRWIVTALRRVVAPARRRDTVNLLLNTLLFTSTAVVIVSGLMISQVALPWLGVVGTVDDVAWRSTHNNWTDVMWVLVCAHIAMNWRWILKVAGRFVPAALKEL